MDSAAILKLGADFPRPTRQRFGQAYIFQPAFSMHAG
jgi:hypothetical protein